MASQLKYLAVAAILEPTEMLRTVQKDSPEYLELVDSIKLRGVMNPISVRECKDEQGAIVYGLVDGLQRLSASKDAGLEEIPSHVIELEDAELLEAQIIANVHKIETKPVEYSKALLKVLHGNPLLLKSELAARLAKTPSWINERLGLLKLTEEIGKLVDEEKIGLSNAYVLAKLPPAEQADFVDRAITMQPQQFTPTVNARIKEIRDAKRAGKDTAPAEFVAVPFLRGKKELTDEMEQANVGPRLCVENSVTDAAGGFALGIKWALQMDPASVLVQKAKDEQRKAEREASREAAAIERKRAKAKEAAEKAAELAKEADELVAKKAKVAQAAAVA
jgi:ParB/RepB/Spo0J family partition protein